MDDGRWGQLGPVLTPIVHRPSSIVCYLDYQCFPLMEEITDMQNAVRVGLIGDYNAQVKAHLAIPRALALSSEGLERRVEPVWLGTRELEGAAERQLSLFDGLWCVPGSPYQSMDGALRAIRFARERGVPFLGTCGGFQHAL